MLPVLYDGNRLSSLLDHWAAPTSTWDSGLDVTDHDDRYELELDVPGFTKDDLSISVESGTLTIVAKRSASASGKKLRRERRMSIARSVAVPPDIDLSKIDAELKDGVIRVTLPKLESARRREITIRS